MELFLRNQSRIHAHYMHHIGRVVDAKPLGEFRTKLCGVPPSVVYLPQSTGSYSPIASMPILSAYEVATISAPPSFLSDSRVALSVPIHWLSSNADFAWSCPMESVLTRPPVFSTIVNAVSKVYRP